MERRLAAILAADVVGYSKLMGEDQVRTLDALRQLRKELFEPFVTEHNGTVIKSMGDGWIVEFPSISDAAACAIEIQQKLKGHETIRLRIGIHTGEVVFEDEDVFGDGVNIAARLEERAEPGTILLSDVAFHSLDGKTARNFCSGEIQKLKNVARQLRVWSWPVNSNQFNGQEGIGSTGKAAFSDKPIIAVLPFDNMSGDPQQEYFVDGLTEDIITSLANVRSFDVIARNTVFTYKGTPIDVVKIGKELSANYILEGSVRRSGNRLRVTGQLLDARDGTHIWAAKFDETIDDVFELQDKLTGAIVNAIAPEMARDIASQSSSREVIDLNAWELVHRANALVWSWRADSVKEALKLIERAYEIDPDNAQVLSSYASVLWAGSLSGFFEPGKKYSEQAYKLARRAVSIEPSSPEANGILAILMLTHADANEARLRAEKAYLLGSGQVRILIRVGSTLAYTGPFDRAIEVLSECIRLNPLDPQIYAPHQVLAVANFGAEKYEEAINEALIVQRLLSEWTECYTLHIASLGQLDRKAEAIELISRVRQIAPDYCVNHAVRRHPYSDESARWRLREGLLQAGVPEHSDSKHGDASKG